MLDKISPVISVVIPVYNGTKYLSVAIDSVLAQTYTDYEIIVIDDGSTDSTWELIQSYGSRVRGFRKSNGGVASALNLGISKMRGQWFAWLSHDDIFSINRLEEDMAIVETNPIAKVIFCRINFINKSGEIIKEINNPIYQVTNTREALMLNGLNMCAMTIHKSCFDKSGLFNENNQTMQDVEMYLRLSCAFQFYPNNQGLTSIRDHPLRGSYTLSVQHKKDMLMLCDFIHNELSFHDFFPALVDNEITKSWIWMGDLYWGFGAKHYAYDAYKIAISSQNNWLRRCEIFIYIKEKKSKSVRIIHTTIRRIIKLTKRLLPNLLQK